MSSAFPAAVYARTVLEPNFEDAKKYFLDALLRIHAAHAEMLMRRGILSEADGAALLSAVGALNRQEISQARYDGSCEDLFFFVEGMLERECGPLAQKLHTARSRNDIAITLYRMAHRRELIKLAIALAELRASTLATAGVNVRTVMPAHTHTQPAQPTTLAHYLLAVAEFLMRDLRRAQAAFMRVNLCPMGACAITTTGFPIDRQLTARLLGFDGIAENSYGAIAAIDYLTEAASVTAVAMVNAGKFTQDLLLWSTREFGFLRLHDGFVQSSSIMPQKRNPVSLEHVRILASRAVGEAQALLTCAHNTPFGDINDSEDDLQPLAFTMFADAERALHLLTGALQTSSFDAERMAHRATADFLTVTELADTLVRSEGLSFRQAHGLVSRAVHDAADDRPESIAAALRANGPELRISDAEIARALDAEEFVQVRRVVGGPSPEIVEEAIRRAQDEQKQIEGWLKEKRETV